MTGAAPLAARTNADKLEVRTARSASALKTPPAAGPATEAAAAVRSYGHPRQAFEVLDGEYPEGIALRQ